MKAGAPVVVVGIDGTDVADAALDVAATEACARHAQLRIVCCWSVPAMVYASGVAPTESVEDVLKEHSELCVATAARSITLRYPELEVETRSVSAPVTSGLVSASEDAVLLVLGSRGRGGLARFVFGSVSRQIAHQAVCPVRIVAPR